MKRYLSYTTVFNDIMIRNILKMSLNNASEEENVSKGTLDVRKGEC